MRIFFSVILLSLFALAGCGNPPAGHLVGDTSGSGRVLKPSSVETGQECAETKQTEAADKECEKMPEETR
jgi:hypothetical protein